MPNEINVIVVTRMTENALQELDVLLEQLCEGLFDDEQLAGKRLVQLLEGSELCRRRYLATMELHTALSIARGRGKRPLEISTLSGQMPSSLPDGMELPGDVYPQSPFITSNTLAPTLGYLCSGWPMAYLVATVMTVVGILICANTYISRPAQVAGDSRKNAEHATPAYGSKTPVVGSITGMADCRWEGSELRGAGFRGERPKESEIRKPNSEISRRARRSF